MRTLRKELLALGILGAALATPASAVPIVFDITGSVYGRSFLELPTWTTTIDHSLDGQLVLAQIVVDTAEFDSPSIVGQGDHDEMRFQSLSGGVSVSLNIGGMDIDTARFSTNRGEVNYIDSYGWIPCGDGSGCSSLTNDQYNIRAVSEELGPNGRSGLTTVQFSAADGFDPAIPGSGMSWFDFSQPQFLDMLLTLPIESSFPPSLSWSEGTYDCAPLCQQTGMWNTGMTIASVTRSTRSVPEPGALGLLAFGLGGVLLARRRRTAAL